MGDHQSNTMTAEQNNFAMRGVLAGHAGWVPSIVTSQENPDTILSSSRDKTVIVWQLTREDTEYGFPKRALTGHSHFVQDVKISSDGLFALSGSWDGTPRRFVGHTKDVLSVAFSMDNRQIVFASRDKSIKLGTPSESASTPLASREAPKATPSGFHASTSCQTSRTQPSCLEAGTRSSRSGTCPTASFAPTSLATPATSTL